MGGGEARRVGGIVLTAPEGVQGRARVTRAGGLGGPMERQGDGARPGGRWAVGREYCKELKASRWAPARTKTHWTNPDPPAWAGSVWRPAPPQANPPEPSDTP